MYEALEGLHQLAALGAFALTLVGAVRGTLPAWQLRLASLLLLVVIVLGVVMTADRWSFGELWISAAFAIAIVIGGVLGAVVGPALRRGGETGRVRLALVAVTVLWLVAAGLMFSKPG